MSHGCVQISFVWMFLTVPVLQTSVFTSKDSRDNYPWEAAFSWVLSLKCSSVAFSSWLWMQEGLGIRGVLLRSAFKRSEIMGDLQSPMFIEQCVPLTTSDLALVVEREQDHLACCRNFHRLFVGRNVLVDCLFLSNLLWIFVGAMCSAYTFELSTERMWAWALALSILLNF